VPSITVGAESATRSVLTRPARDVYTVNQSDPRVSNGLRLGAAWQSNLKPVSGLTTT